MQLGEIQYDSAAPVDGYGPGFFRIGGQVYEGAVLTGPMGTQAWGGYGDAGALIAIAGQIDILFLGTGTDTAHPPADFRSAVEGAGIGLEPMASPAAARTYNILLSEGRRVALAMLPVD